MPPFDFARTTSLVTGASSGLGAEFARQLAARGGDLVLVARSADRLAALAEELRTRQRVTVTVWPTDLSVADEVSRVAALTATAEVHVLVNNAGFGTYGSFAGLDAGHEHAEVMVNAVAEPETGGRQAPHLHGCSFRHTGCSDAPVRPGTPRRHPVPAARCGCTRIMGK